MPRCAWVGDDSTVCTGAAVEDKKHGLCEEHRAEQIRLHKIKVDNWRMKKEARDVSHLAIMSAMTSAEKDALFTVVTQLDPEKVRGEIRVVAAIQRGALQNFVLGTNKGYLPQAGWYGHAGTAFKELIGGLSLAGARRYADEFNTRLGDLGVTGITAVPVI